MLALPRQNTVQLLSNLPATPSTGAYGTRATASASTNTKGSWTQVNAALPFDSYGFWIAIAGTATSATLTDVLLDIGIGGSGSEIVLVPDLLAGWVGTPTQDLRNLWIPIFIPKGTRVAVRCQAQIASDTVDVMFFFRGGRPDMRGELFSGCDAYGVSSSGASTGIAHTPGSTGAESSWASLGSALSRDYGAALLLVQGAAATTETAIAYHWEVGISSTTLAEWYWMGNTGEYLVGPVPPEAASLSLPSGSQLQVRAEGSGTSIAHDVAAYCFY
jgi:hypothetical protein